MVYINFYFKLKLKNTLILIKLYLIIINIIILSDKLLKIENLEKIA